jgi:hypothetical protein
MDYEVFIVSRIKEAHDAGMSTDGAVVEGLGPTGPLVTSAALILFFALSALGAGPHIPVKIFAAGMAAGVLLDATVIRPLIVPAVVSRLGERAWWTPERRSRERRVAREWPRQEAAGRFYLGRVPQAAGRRLPATPHLASEYVQAAGAANLEILACDEPRWGVVDEEGGPLAQEWCPVAAAVAYRDTAAALVWSFRVR